MKELRYKKLRFQDKVEAIRKYLRIIFMLHNIKVTNLEIDVLSEFLKYYSPIVEETFGLFSTKIRKRVMENLNISHTHLWNKLNSLQKKGILLKEDGEFKINKGILPPEGNRYLIVIDIYHEEEK